MKTISTQTATPGQIKKIHVLLQRLGLMDDKASIISDITNGRTESSRALYFDEARTLIVRMAEYDPMERMKSLIFSLAYRAGIIYGSGRDDKRINAAKLNLFLKERGAVKKDLNEMTYPELTTIHRQFEAIAKNVKRSADNKEATAAVRHLLTDLPGILVN